MVETYKCTCVHTNNVPEVEVGISATADCKVINICEDIDSVGKGSLSANILLKGCLQEITWRRWLFNHVNGSVLQLPLACSSPLYQKELSPTVHCTGHTQTLSQSFAVQNDLPGKFGNMRLQLVGFIGPCKRPAHIAGSIPDVCSWVGGIY